MSAYAFINTPFGNFAVALGTTEDTHYRAEAVKLFLYPIGELSEVPTKPGFPAGVTYLDNDAVTAEARRQWEEMGLDVHPYIVPSPIFTINRAQYSPHMFEVELYTYGTSAIESVQGQRAASINSSAGLTDAAEAKLGEWILAHEAEILTPELLAQTEYERALSDAHWAEEKAERAHAEYKEARDERATANRRVQKARTALTKLGAAE